MAATLALNKGAANELVNTVPIAKHQVAELWNACKQLDRETSGKLDVNEFVRAVRTAQLDLAPEQLQTLVHVSVGGCRAGVCECRVQGWCMWV